MAGEVNAVRVENLAQLRKDMRAVSADAPKELRVELKASAAIVADASRGFAPRRTGALAASIVPGTRGDKAVVRSRLPYANAQHWGGTVGRGHQLGPGRGATRIKPTLFVLKGLEQQMDAVVNRIGDGIDAVAARHGWK